MTEFIISDCVRRNGRRHDIEIREGRIDRILPAGEGDPSAFPADRRHDADGRLVTSTLTEPHVHLDSALTAGVPRWNRSNTLPEGTELWAEARETLDKSDFKSNAERVLRWFIANGITRVRSHVFIGYPSNPNAEALLELKEEYSDYVDMQLVAFPSKRLVTDRDVGLFEDAMDMGMDLVGGYPDAEKTHNQGIEHLKTILDIAQEYECPLDTHIDESDDPQSRFTEVLAGEVIDREMGDRTTASHTTAMHSYPNSYADKVVRLVAESGINVVTNPLINSVVQGRHDTYPIRRGHTRIEELRSAGVTVGMGQDDIVDCWNTYGDGDPLSAAFVLVHYAQMDGIQEVESVWDILIDGNAEVFGATDYQLQEGNPGSLIVYDGRDPFDVLRRRADRRLVLKEGNPIAKTTSKTEVIDATGDTSDVNNEFIRNNFSRN